MKIYFAGSIRGGREDQEIYAALIEEVARYGVVLTEHIGHLSLTDGGEVHISNDQIFTRDMGWVREADVIIAEVSTPSLGVGYELGQAEALGKPILCLFRPKEGKRLSAMVAGNHYVQVSEYQTREEAAEVLADYFKLLVT